MGLLVGLAAIAVPGLLGLYMAKSGHSKIITDVFVFAILCVLGVSFALMEVINLMIWPFRLIRRLIGLGPKRMDPEAASAAATGRKTTEKRKIVVFDGICVLCNRFGRFIVSHLPDPNEVSFVPFQDPMANPHINVKNLEKEFDFKSEQLQDRIACIEGDEIYWGPDAVITILGWCYFPFPVAKLGLLVPYPIRDAAYLTVAKNRYRWFGTQHLDQNFAKNLCPYIYIKKSFGSTKQD